MKRRSLYEIESDIEALAEIITALDGEIPDDEAGATIERWFDDLGEERDRKIDGYCALIREFEALAAVRSLEADRLQALARTDENNAKRLKERLKAFLDRQGIKKLETTRFKISVQANGGAIPLLIPAEWDDDPAAAPEAFQRRTVVLDRDAIREALRNDEEAHGAELGERGSHLRIR